MSVLTKVFILLFPIVTYLILWGIFRFFGLKRYTKLRVIDLWTPFLIYGADRFVTSATQISLFPYFLLAAAGMGILLLVIAVFITKQFQAGPYFRRFWRALFFMSTSLYISLIIAAFFMH
ncbi:MAG: DUF3397 domain-containing protein [Streptococcaceae bacterium]|jgi:hypothetical protein|nr:DUF3397 domain-containing protein [Streptococcaceae bacterium]